MNENAKWRAHINQKYGVSDSRFVDNTLIVDLRIKAKTAQEALDKAKAYIKAEKIERAFVCSVYRDGVPTTDVTEV